MSHEGVFCCIASNVVDTVSSRCELLVDESSDGLPQLKRTLADNELTLGSEVKLSIEIGNQCWTKVQPSVEWFKDDKVLDERHDKYTTNFENGVHNLKFVPTGPEDEGLYKVVVKNNKAELVSVAEMKFPFVDKNARSEEFIVKTNVQNDFEIPEVKFDINEEPEFVSLPQSIRVNENERATLRCSAVGNPVPKIKWLDPKKQEILRKGRIRHETSDGYTILTIDEVCKDDEGPYTCVAFNASGEISTNIDLLVDKVLIPANEPSEKRAQDKTAIVIEQIDSMYLEPKEVEIRYACSIILLYFVC